MARTAIPASVPVGTAITDHPFVFRGQAYRRIEDVFTAGAVRPPTISQTEREAIRAAQDAAQAELQRRHDEREAAKVATVTVERERKAADKEKKAQHDEALAWVAAYTGTWGLPLDIRADRRWGTKYMKLSERQVEVLLAGKARDAARAEAAQIDRELFAADQWEAHRVASAALAAPRAAVRADHADPLPVALREPARSPGLVTEDGMYRTADGTIWKVQRAVNGSGHLYAKRLVVEDGSGSFVYEPGAIRRLSPDNRMTLEEAKAFGQLYGVCCQCGRTLTDEQSIADGIGKVCAGRL